MVTPREYPLVTVNRQCQAHKHAHCEGSALLCLVFAIKTLIYIRKCAKRTIKTEYVRSLR